MSATASASAAKAATQQLSLKTFHPTSFKNKTVVRGYLKCPGYSPPHPTQSHHLPGAAVYRQAIGLKPPAVGLFFRESGNNNSQPKHGLFFHAGLGFSNPFFKKT